MNVTRREEGQVLQVLGDRVTVKLPSGRSPHGMSIVDVVVPPGSGTPCVTHDKEEEVYFLLEGELLMHTPTERHHLHPGDLVHLPPLTPHGYRNPGEQPARFLAWTVGGPMDGFFERMAHEVQQLPRDLPRMQAAMDAFGVRRVA
jgi:mannose-6-phosphate isomerase-like protein (cupin superfamily)